MADMNYHHLRYFRAVAHDGQLTRTADRLNVSQSALSAQIKTLETQLGHALFERRGRQLHLTEAGRIALDHADTIFTTGDELLDTLRETGRARQAVRVGALSTLSRNFQVQFLRPVLGRPEVEVILRSGNTADLLLGLEALSLDLVLLNRPPATDAASRFVAHALTTETASVVGRPDLLDDAGVEGEAALVRLIQRRPVILPTPESGLRTGFDAWASRAGLRPQIAAEIDDMAMMRLLAREGAGLAVVPPIVVQDELATGSLVEAGHLPGVSESFYAVTVDRRFPNPHVRALLDQVAA